MPKVWAVATESHGNVIPEKRRFLRRTRHRPTSKRDRKRQWKWSTVIMHSWGYGRMLENTAKLPKRDNSIRVVNRLHSRHQISQPSRQLHRDHEDNAVAEYERTIAVMATDELNRSGYCELKGIACDYQYRGGVLIMHGVVSSFYMKQVAQTVVKVIEQVYEIKNRVNVVYRSES